MNHTIPVEIYSNICQKIPVINDEVKTLFYRDFLFNMHDLIHGGNLGISLVCLRDAYFRLDASKISLYSAYVQNLFYEQYHEKAPLNIESIRFAKHHLDYVPLNLYAFQEDLAEFIIKYKSLDDDFNKWKKEPKTKELLDGKRVISNAGKTGLFLKAKHTQLQFTSIVLKLESNKYWKKAIKYRNSWVHEKPPIIEGLGIQHNRESRIKIEDKRKSFDFGGSSTPNYTINELFEICTKAIEVGVKAVNDIITIIDDDEKNIRERIKFS